MDISNLLDVISIYLTIILIIIDLQLTKSNDHCFLDFSYNTPAPAWSCAWNDYDTNYIYCGLQNGTCLIFDVRNTDTYLKSLQNATGGSCPVISVAHVSPDPNGDLR